MDAAPIWSNLKTFPWAEFRDRVDILTGGYPCQPFSAAGKRLGTEDPRHLWPFIADGIRLLRPRLCYFENVEGHISLGLREVVGELEQIGYSTAWGIFSASEVGAPHQRKRVFILAYDKSQRIQGHGADWLQESRPHAGQGLPLEEDRISSEHREEEYSRRELRRADAAPAWPSRPGEPQHGWEPPRVVANTQSSMSGVKAEREWRENTGGRSEEIVGNAPSPRCPRPEDAGADRSNEGQGPWREESERASHMGNASTSRRPQHQPRFNDPQNDSCTTDQNEHDGQAQPALGRDADGTAGGLGYAELQVSCDNRTDELRLLGNGVVPATADRAFRILIEELFTMEGQE